MYTKRSFLGLFICELFTVANQSIVGVTYRDKFDFEERNRHDICNPLYWHPLHMPDHCIAMYEKLIRNKLNNTHPYKYKDTENDEKNVKKLKRLLKNRRRQQSSSGSSESSDESSKYTECSSSKESQSNSEQTNESRKDHSKQLKYYEYVNTDVRQPPYQQMLNEIRNDVMVLPAMPVIGLIPPLGLATIYRQPISKKTEKTIKKIAGAYASAARDSYAETANLFTNPYPLHPEPGDNNITEPPHEDNNGGKPNNNKKQMEMNKDAETKMKFEINKMMQPIHEKLGNKPDNQHDKKKPQVQTKKITNGNMVTYIQKKGYFS